MKIRPGSKLWLKATKEAFEVAMINGDQVTGFRTDSKGEKHSEVKRISELIDRNPARRPAFSFPRFKGD
jgi:hypothetical protein